MQQNVQMSYLPKFFPMAWMLFPGIIGCAGPTSPLGPATLFANKLNVSIRALIGSNEHLAINRQISFFPNRQILHKKSSLEITISDDEGIPEDYQLKIYFDRRDVTRHFIQHSIIEWEPRQNRWLKLKMPVVRLRSDLDGEIVVSYQRNNSTPMIAAEYQKPKCNLKANKALTFIEDFDVEPNTLKFINAFAEANEINPFLLAGLIAQESGFQNNAFSYSRAMGLTQITPIGEQEILKVHSNWPRYPGLNELPLGYIKFMLQQGQLNSTNEWRLNPEYSINGGSTYIRQLESYWSRSDKAGLLQAHFSNLEQDTSRVVLASYNSGPYRVSQAIEQNHHDWLKRGAGLDAARKYVNRVMSFCDRFSEEIHE